MAYNFQAIPTINHPFLGAGQTMPLPPGAAPPMQPTGHFPLNPGMMPGMGPNGQSFIGNGQPFTTNDFSAPLSPANVLANPGNAAGGFDHNGWHQAMQAWQAQRPDESGRSGKSDPALAAWRNLHPVRANY